NVRRTHHQRVANLFRFLNRHFDGGNGGVRRLFQFQTVNRMLEIVRIEKPKGVIVQYGGQTPLKLARALEAAGVPVIGTSPDA
ncbi:hypothetical protein, partial [Escherichia coli]|uniref:carbamoyl phosphate synthase preATP-grasp domain-containing protein n=1 Tax=Escherichia coli TaxID=562 RepID=UPI003F4E886B